MDPILAPCCARVLEALARRRALLAFDLDGTLAPTVADPDAAALRPETRRLLKVTALLYPCAVVSGRRRSDALARLEGIPLRAVVGTQGNEPGYGPVDRSVRELVATWREVLVGALPRGVRLEDKGLLLAIHHRGVEAAREVRRQLIALASQLPGARVLLGRDVIHVTAEDAPGKGVALEALRRREGLEAALYVGDDASDEDAFRAWGVEVAVRVGRSARSAAAYYVPDQAAVDELLRALVRARAALDGRADRAAALEAALG